VERPTPVPDLDAEQEVDLRSVWDRIAARWWLPVLGVVLGLIGGFLLALGGGKVYEAETLVAMGQPFSPNGGAPVQAFLTNPRAVSEFIRSESALRKATFNQQLDSIQDSLNTLAPRITAAEQAVNEPGLSSLDKLVVFSALDNAQARRGQLLDLQSDVQQQLALAENVEKAQVVEPAAAVKTTARSGRNGALVGGLIGLLLGCAAALLADPFLARRARTA
jgi:uncharacterized protein involved in exopolysaccharide biosynthesis